MDRYLFSRMDFFRGSQLDSLNSESPDKGELKPVLVPLPESRSGDHPTDEVKSPREEQIELMMKNIKEFIRGIDVKSL